MGLKPGTLGRREKIRVLLTAGPGRDLRVDGTQLLPRLGLLGRSPFVVATLMKLRVCVTVSHVGAFNDGLARFQYTQTLPVKSRETITEQNVDVGEREDKSLPGGGASAARPRGRRMPLAGVRAAPESPRRTCRPG